MPGSWSKCRTANAVCRALVVVSVAVLAAALAMPLSVAHADTYYVATTGDDAGGDGSAARPYRTIAHAVNVGVGPGGGHNVVVRDGVYHGLNTLRRAFPVTVTVRAENPYRATLTNVDGGHETIRIYVKGPARIAVEGLVLTNRHPSYTCPNGREPMYIVHVQDASNVVLRDNIIFGNNAPGTCNELVKINRSDTAMYPRNIEIRGNLLFEPANAGGADIIDSVRPGEIDITGNIFLSQPERNRSQSFITLKRQAPATNARSPRYRIRRNVFLNWGGKSDQAFVQFGEDGVPEHEITDALVENNLFIGNSPAPLAAPVQIKGARGVRYRANTVVGNLPGGAYGFRIGTEAANPTVGDIVIRNNVWSDPTGTMGRRLINAYGDVDLASIILDRNLFWNAGQELPASGAITPAADARRLVADPGLNPDQAGIVLPIWDPDASAFPSGSATIRDELLRLVEAYGAPAAGSPVVDAADPADMPRVDIRGLPRDARPDLGAYERGAGASATPSPPMPATATATATKPATPQPTGVPWRHVYLPRADRGEK